MDSTCDVFLTKLPKNINDVVIRNLFSTTGKVLKVKIIDDKRNENQKLCFVGFKTMDEALEAVRIADYSVAFGEPIRASITKKCLETMDNRSSNNNTNCNGGSGNSNGRQMDSSPSNRFGNIGRGRGFQTNNNNMNNNNNQPSFKSVEIKLSDIKLKLKELIDVEIIDLKRIDFIMARPIKSTENSKIEISDSLSKINANQSILARVDSPKIGCAYLGKWDDDCYYRAELLEILSDGSFKVAFIDEGTSDDIVSELREIPAGTLQQYPKQFVKLNLGVADDDDLKEFILRESEGKVVKIYWLGEEASPGAVPLVNLFFDEDEVLERYSAVRKRQIRKSFSTKFDNLPSHRPAENVHLKLVPSSFKSGRDFQLQFPDSSPATVTMANRKSPSILPLPGDLCVYERRSQLFRCAIKRRQLFSFDIHLIDTGESISNVNIDNLYTPDESHRSRAPATINCELDDRQISGDLVTQLNDERVTFNIVQYNQNTNRYLVSINVPVAAQSIHYQWKSVDCRQFVGTGVSVTVSHVVSPVNFFVQIDKDEYTRDLLDIQEKINMNYNGARFASLDAVRVDQAVVAPFIAPGTDSELFRARVIETRREAPHVHVLFIDYGNDEWVEWQTLYNVDDELAGKAGLALPCRLAVDIRKEAWAHAVDQFFELIGLAETDGAPLRMQVQAASGDRLVVDLVSLLKGSVTALLVKGGTCVEAPAAAIATAKPVCNGDAPPVCNGLGEKSAPKIDSVSASGSEDKLIQKIIELEKRICILESLLLKN